VNDSSTPTGPPHDDDEGRVRRERGDWISGPSLSEETVKLGELRAQHPGWTIWKGRHTGSWWACPPPPGMTLLDAPDLDRLEAMILDVKAWGGRR
jgi:hypothetical protein